MKAFEQLNFKNYFQQLPAELYSRHKPEALLNQRLVHVNQRVANLFELNPKEFERTDIIDLVCGFSKNINYESLAMCYSGHQFGHFAGRLGDGRAILLAEVETQFEGKLDLHLKGAGKTLYSRQGDGKAVLRSTIREYLCSEAMFHLGISTSQALCMTTSDEEVYRERIESGAMLLRVAPSHIRFGHFEYAFYSHKHDYLKELANYVLEHHYADVKHNQQGYLFLLKQAIKKTAKMIAQWQSVGFMHGVMNTDNMSILGLTIDYGPFGFMDSFESGFICNHSDHAGRYSYKNQPEIGLFNLSCLAQTFLPLLNDDVDEAVTIAKSELTQYQKLYEQYYLEIMQQKLGLESVAISFIEQLFSLMEVHKVDFTIFFRLLSELNTNQNRQTVIDLFSGSSDFNDWFEQYQQLVAYQSEELETRSIRMKLVNPKYVLRNYLAEQAIRLAEDENDFSEVERLMELLAKPFDEQEESEHYAVTPPRWSEELSISCSS